MHIPSILATLLILPVTILAAPVPSADTSNRLARRQGGLVDIYLRNLNILELDETNGSITFDTGGGSVSTRELHPEEKRQEGLVDILLRNFNLQELDETNGEPITFDLGGSINAHGLHPEEKRQVNVVIDKLPINPNTGLPYDPVTGTQYNPFTGLAITSITEVQTLFPGITNVQIEGFFPDLDPRSANLLRRDAEEKRQIDVSVDSLPINPTTNLPFDPYTGIQYNPNMGIAITSVAQVQVLFPGLTNAQIAALFPYLISSSITLSARDVEEKRRVDNPVSDASVGKALDTNLTPVLEVSLSHQNGGQVVSSSVSKL